MCSFCLAQPTYLPLSLPTPYLPPLPTLLPPLPTSPPTPPAECEMGLQGSGGVLNPKQAVQVARQLMVGGVLGRIRVTLLTWLVEAGDRSRKDSQAAQVGVPCMIARLC